MNVIQSQQLHVQNYKRSQRPLFKQEINYLMINSPANDQFVRQNSVAFEGKSAQKTKDLSGQWEYFLGDELPQTEKSPIGKMSLPSNWFLMGKKQFPSKFKVDETKPFDIDSDEKPDPDKGLNYSGTVIYRKTIKLKDSPDPDKPYFLDLDMVDYYGRVFLNGKPVGKLHEGYFQPWSVNLSDAKDQNGLPLLKKGKNQILIKVSDPALPFDDTNMLNGQIINQNEDKKETNKQKCSVSFPKRQNKVKGVLGFHDCRPGSVHKRGQECSTGGIIRGINLRQSSGIDILSTKITPVFDPDKVSTDGASIKMQFQVTNLTDKPRKILLNGQISPYNFKDKNKASKQQGQTFSKTVIIPPHETMPIEYIESVKNPKLWWTWDKGYPHLYQMKVTVEEKAQDGKKDKILDQKSNVFGIKSVSRDKNGVHYLNGERFYPRGTNYISTQYLSQADQKWYQRDINLIKNANLNTVLVHAHVARPEFYDLCDREGIAVIQGFPLIWTYTENPSFTEKAKLQAKEMVELYGGHPSIIEWIAHNEGSKNPALDDNIADVIQSNDSSGRPVIRNSGEKNLDRNPQDGHTYPEWYIAATPDWTLDDMLSKDRFYDRQNDKCIEKNSPFVTEFGAQSLSEKSTLKKIFNKQALKLPETINGQEQWTTWTYLSDWIYANFQPKQMFEIAKVRTEGDIDRFISNSQKNQARLLQYEIEYLRRHKWDKEKPNTGEIEFMFVDPWRAASSWAVVDYDRNTKPGYEALKKANQPLLPVIKYEWGKPDSQVEIVLVNDKNEDFNDLTLKYQLGKGKIKSQKIQKLQADSVQPVISLGVLPSVVNGQTPLRVWIENSKGKIISTNSINDFED